MKKLLFVYNADSGKWNAYLDMAHKIFSPSTYPCSLCDITYGIFKIRPEWDEFIQNTSIPFEFLHKDEFLTAYPNSTFRDFPFILAVDETEALSMFLPAEQLNEYKTVEALKQAIKKNPTIQPFFKKKLL
ncbi:MAG: hypothetical protein RLZZ292_3085 [Bacteroidota bacterium]|jgi:hypothetical protein